MPEVGLEARFLFMLEHDADELGKFLLHDGDVFCSNGVEYDELISRLSLRPGAAGVWIPLGRVARSAFGADQGRLQRLCKYCGEWKVVAEVDGCVDILMVGKSDRKLWS